jgi:hypothetical protein
MRPSSHFVLLAVLSVSVSACSSPGPSPGPDISIAQHWSDGSSWMHPLGNCAHWEPDVAVRECTSKLEGGLYPQSDRVAAHALRASSYVSLGDFNHALLDYNEAVRLDPKDTELLNTRAWLLATAPEDNVRNGAQAMTDALAALEQKPQSIGFFDTLAAAYAENGDFERAVEVQESAIALASLGDQVMMAELQKHLALYSQNMPYRDALAGFAPTVWYGIGNGDRSQRNPGSVVVLPQRPVADIRELDSSE